jgi:hypothetical protein
MAFDERAAIDRFWEARRSGEYFPEDWRDRLDFDQAYRVQLGVVERRVAQGEQQVGWKVAQTSEETRRQFGFHEPIFGCLMEEGPGGPRTPTGKTNSSGPAVSPRCASSWRRRSPARSMPRHRGPESTDNRRQRRAEGRRARRSDAVR